MYWGDSHLRGSEPEQGKKTAGVAFGLIKFTSAPGDFSCPKEGFSHPQDGVAFLYPSSWQAVTDVLAPTPFQRLSSGLDPWKRAFTRHKSVNRNLEFMGWLSAPSLRPRLFFVTSRILAAFSRRQPPWNPLPLPPAGAFHSIFTPDGRAVRL